MYNVEIGRYVHYGVRLCKVWSVGVMYIMELGYVKCGVWVLCTLWS